MDQGDRVYGGQGMGWQGQRVVESRGRGGGVKGVWGGRVGG